jgi:hypothetical protein
MKTAAALKKPSIPRNSVKLSPDMVKFFHYVMKLPNLEPAHIDDAVEVLETISGKELALICGRDKADDDAPPESMWPPQRQPFPPGLRYELFQELNEIDLADSFAEDESMYKIGCGWLIELLGEGTVKDK